MSIEMRRSCTAEVARVFRRWRFQIPRIGNRFIWRGAIWRVEGFTEDSLVARPLDPTAATLYPDGAQFRCHKDETMRAIGKSIKEGLEQKRAKRIKTKKAVTERKPAKPTGRLAAIMRTSR